MDVRWCQCRLLLIHEKVIVAVLGRAAVERWPPTTSRRYIASRDDRGILAGLGSDEPSTTYAPVS